MPVGVLEDQRKIGQLSLLRKLHNTQHGYAYFEGEILYKEHQDTTYLDHRSRGNLLTQRRWILDWRSIAVAFSAFDSNGQGGICWCRFCVRCLSNRLVLFYAEFVIVSETVKRTCIDPLVWSGQTRGLLVWLCVCVARQSCCVVIGVEG